LVSRLANLLLITITGLPVLSLLQFMGGVDPNLVLAGFAATGMTMASLAGLSILNSVWAKKPRDAIALTYLGAGAYLILSALGLILTVPALGMPGIVTDLIGWLNAGNVFTALYNLDDALTSGGRMDDVLPVLLRDYAVFHGIVAVGCSAWA